MFTKKEAYFEKLRVNELPALPHVLNEILEACQSESAGLDRLANIIRHDGVLTAKLIATANSANYFQNQRVNSIDRALLLIGTEHTKTIAVTAAVQQYLATFNAYQTEYLKTFWTVSLRCALLARTFAKLIHYARPEQAYLTGLLHNIGELALRSNFPSEFKQIDQPQSAEEDTIISRENKIIGTNHCEFGAWLLERWGMEEFAAAAIQYHHDPLPMLLDAHPLVKIIYLASHLGDIDNYSNQTGFAAARQLFGLNNDLTEKVNAQTQHEIFDIAASLQIELAAEAESSELARIQQQDEKRHITLGHQVREIGLQNIAREHMNVAVTLTDLGRAIEESAFLLFGFTAVRLFLIDEEPGVLRYVDFNWLNQESDDDNSLQLEVPLEQARSIMSASILSNKVIASAQWETKNGDLPVIDKHILNLLKTPQMICVPIQKTRQNKSEYKHQGLLAFGSHRPLETSVRFTNMLRVFAYNAGKRFQQANQAINTGNQATTPEEQQLRLREINHEISNPLTIISNYLEILSDRLAKDNQAHQELSIIREEIKRVGDILVKLGDDKSAGGKTSGTDVNREIQDIVRLFTASLFLTKEIQCHIDADTNLKPQAIPRSYLKQILINLIKNAVEALVKGGEITISTNHHVNVNGKRYMELTVKDNGPGIDTALIPTLFDSTGSSKGDNHSGLGLSITKSLVDELNGLISCRSTKQGAVFQVLLPARDWGADKQNKPISQAFDRNG